MSLGKKWVLYTVYGCIWGVPKIGIPLNPSLNGIFHYEPSSYWGFFAFTHPPPYVACCISCCCNITWTWTTLVRMALLVSGNISTSEFRPWSQLHPDTLTAWQHRQLNEVCFGTMLSWTGQHQCAAKISYPSTWSGLRSQHKGEIFEQVWLVHFCWNHVLILVSGCLPPFLLMQLSHLLSIYIYLVFIY